MTGRRGFTLIEVLVGLTIAGAALLIARGLFREAADRGRAVLALTIARAERARALQWLRSALGSLQVGLADDDTFDGQSDRVEFTSRLETGNGWLEARRIAFFDSSAALRASVKPGRSFALFSGIERVECHYLLTAGERSEWLRGWRSPATAPIALRVVLWHQAGGARVSAPGADTLVFRIGPRS